MSTGELSNVESAGGGIQPSGKFDDAMFEKVAASGSYLPRLQMYGSNSTMVKEGKIGMAHYGLVKGKDQVTDLGKSVDLLALEWRPKAMDVKGEDIITAFDPEDPEFLRIQELSDVQDSGCMCGPEFLVYIPSLKMFATLYMSSKSARREAKAIRTRLGYPSTLGTEFIKGKRYSWHAIACSQCSTPFEFPDDEELADVKEKFLNPPKQEVEKIQSDPNATPRRTR